MKSSSYLDRQAMWLKKNGLKKGDILIVAKSAETSQDGWSNSWIPEMDLCIGKKAKFIGGVAHSGGVSLVSLDSGNRFGFPYFVLRKNKLKVG